MEDKQTYIRLRKSLDSLRDVALNEIELIESEAEKIEFADFMTEKVKMCLKNIASKRGQAWLKMKDAQAKKFQAHAEELLSKNASRACPPGFVEVDGICVRL